MHWMFASCLKNFGHIMEYICSMRNDLSVLASLDKHCVLSQESGCKNLYSGKWEINRAEMTIEVT